jgi:predicted secreted Zn-dependent protease
MRYLITFTFAYLILLSSAAAEVSKNLSYSYYDVSVRHDQPLRPQMLAVTPIREEGSPFIGFTKWNIRWSFKWNADRNGSCRITSSSTELVADILLPRLSGASVEQIASFNGYIVILRQHELGHYNIAEEAAQRIDSDLKNIPVMGNCKMLEDYANTTSRSTLDRFNEKSRQYDRDTKHGETQGMRRYL